MSESETSGSTSTKARPRQNWSSKLDYVISTIGYAVGLGNIWRFPYLCYTSGGGAFLIPYFLTLFLVAIPLLLMESAVGQFTRNAPIKAIRRLCPLLCGTGISIVIMTYLFCLYYSIVICWAVYYLYLSLASVSSGSLPWTYCNDALNAPLTCWNGGANESLTKPNNTISPGEQFFFYDVLQLSGSVGRLGTVRLPLFLSLMCVWILVYFTLFKGIKWSAKVIYLTALFPYVLLLAILIMTSLLPGAKNGALFFITPDFSRLKDPKVWLYAAIQNFNSVGIAFGSLIVFGSFNKFKNNFVIDNLVLAGANAGTSLMAGFVVFMALGYISKQQKMSIESAVTEGSLWGPAQVTKGSGLVFIVYPTAFTTLSVSHMWSFLFFLMLILLGIDSLFASLEVLITTLQDAELNFVGEMRREILVALVCLSSFLLSVPMTTQGGYYAFELLNYYSSGVSLVYIAFFECIAVVWFFGCRKLTDAIEDMTGWRPWRLLQVLWVAVGPLFILVNWIVTWTSFGRLSLRIMLDKFHYPDWAIAIGWLIALLSLIPIPISALYIFYLTPGQNCAQKLKTSIRPEPESSKKTEIKLLPQDGKSVTQGMLNNSGVE